MTLQNNDPLANDDGTPIDIDTEGGQYDPRYNDLCRMQAAEQWFADRQAGKPFYVPVVSVAPAHRFPDIYGTNARGVACDENFVPVDHEYDRWEMTR